MNLDSLGALLSVLGGMMGLIGFGFGLYQYYVAQKWKKSEFAARLLEQLADDERLEACCIMLDWASRKLTVPPQYKALGGEETFLHTWEKLSLAMTPEAEQGVYDWQEVLYRDLFDHFFSYLERINHYISIRLITVRDVASLRYWLDQLARPRFTDTAVFLSFLKAYDYDGVLDLMRKFEIPIRPDTPR